MPPEPSVVAPLVSATVQLALGGPPLSALVTVGAAEPVEMRVGATEPIVAAPAEPRADTRPPIATCRSARCY